MPVLFAGGGCVFRARRPNWGGADLPSNRGCRTHPRRAPGRQARPIKVPLGMEPLGMQQVAVAGCLQAEAQPQHGLGDPNRARPGCQPGESESDGQQERTEPKSLAIRAHKGFTVMRQPLAKGNRPPVALDQGGNIPTQRRQANEAIGNHNHQGGDQSGRAPPVPGLGKIPPSILIHEGMPRESGRPIFGGGYANKKKLGRS